ncbi:hypothetical protein EMIHUDRAFT_115422 [Emiliania huxleyi CCMP1516]|uniref:Nucleotide-diphospho-sugar transferase domain-containing protein n=2 Tax=Emiliania huxleyi TaxID=2903 RepID=A0A0D3JPU9_EMIH1|nr:hypothetical protein EMIHUDRAFT_115422 [Emiliania huxleyi CCMP1516]EOD25534.1 hypothetical protein EMIHUDRAFT_115422 [Emiliania huxleyi CCMP1516]|eukprot:XP_005777963.1 hypothetical protein EMIHUDRAFT_115422 [Emiliania huxleyi CCMP1516]
MQDLANGDISADLIIYQEMEFVQRATAMRLFGRAAACFRNLAVVTAHLAHEDDSYPRAPNVMFYQLATELLKLRAYSYWVQLETDSVPLRPRWLEYLAARIPPRTDGFWVKGSAPRHHCSWCNLEEGYHINGNALYNARDEAFLAFIQRTWSFAGNHTEPYDVALFERARSSDRSTWTMLGGKSVGRLFQFSDVIVSYYWPIAFERAVRRYPCATLKYAPLCQNSVFYSTQCNLSALAIGLIVGAACIGGIVTLILVVIACKCALSDKAAAAPKAASAATPAASGRASACSTTQRMTAA